MTKDPYGLFNALERCLNTMEMQLKREAGEFHISAANAQSIWDDTVEEAEKAIAYYLNTHCRECGCKTAGNGERGLDFATTCPNQECSLFDATHTHMRCRGVYF